ncbi:hypothetical protein SELMODRAFT_439849 [Selaginella moellendorffii]|uniref:C2 domain-containing protein n=1 Tax=Selaginella moellendorffii TaxID=88036 RepID=D8R7S6_SELML|nr:hypothetical protein SELMODRAFT_439849 [Selaginella moellendorffii]
MSAGTLEVFLIGATDIKNCDILWKSDPYAILKFKGQSFQSSTAKGQGSTPKWNEKFVFSLEGESDVPLEDETMFVKLFDKDHVVGSDDFIGTSSSGTSSRQQSRRSQRVRRNPPGRDNPRQSAEDSEVRALLNFKISVDDPLAALNDWKAGTNVCHWIGLLPFSHRARALEISSNQLVGGVPEDMCINCRSLQELSLSSNNLTGELSGLRSSNSLQKLNLSTNVFTSFQIEQCPTLEELDLSFNNISGTVFRKDLLSLRFLVLGHNKLQDGLSSEDKFQAGSGSSEVEEDEITEITFPLLIVYVINKELSICKAYEEVFILQGIRLDDFEHKDGSSCLLILDLSHNTFTGINSLICETYMCYFSHTTYLQGPFLRNLKNLEWLDLSQNWLESHIPDSLGNFTFLKHLNIL